VSKDDYQELVDGLASFLSGDTESVLADLEASMWEAAEREEFEQAARYRDRQEDVRRAMLRQEVVTQSSENFDLIAFHGDELETAFQVLNVRRGRVVGERSTIVDRVEVLTDAELMGRIVRELYGDTEPPREVLVSLMPDEFELLTTTPALWTDRVFTHRIARLEHRLMALEALEFAMARAMRQGRAPGVRGSTSKLLSSELQKDIAEAGMHAAGYGGLELVPVRPLSGPRAPEFPGCDLEAVAMPRYLNLRAASIYGGSSEIQREIIAKHVLGLS
jgi:hypothetical protein